MLGLGGAVIDAVAAKLTGSEMWIVSIVGPLAVTPCTSATSSDLPGSVTWRTGKRAMSFSASTQYDDYEFRTFVAMCLGPQRNG